MPSAAVAMMTDKTVFADNHFPVAVGKAAVQAMFAAQNNLFTTGFQVPVDEVRVVADTAAARGLMDDQAHTQGRGPGSNCRRWELASVVATRQADRSWKWDWVIANSNQPMPGTTANGAEEQAIVQIERDWAAAAVKRDVAVLEGFLAKEWTLVSDGQLTTRAAVIADLKSGAYQFESATVHDLNVHVFGDVAIATMTGETKGKYKGADISGSSRGTDFFVKRDGRWQAVSTQNTTIKP